MKSGLQLAAVALTGLAALALVGCGPAQACQGDACGCSVARQLPTGECCNEFSNAEGAVCRIRTWQMPTTADAVGEPGAHALSVALDASGNGVAAWVNVPADQLQSEVTVADEVEGWQTRMPGADLEGFGNRPSLAAGPSGAVLVAWRQELVEDSRVHVAARDSETAWQSTTDAAPLSSPPLANQPFAHISALGEAFVIYNQFHETEYGVAVARRSMDAAPLAFERPSDSGDLISPAINFSNAPRIATAANGDALISWYQSPEPAGDLVVYASRRQGAAAPFSHPQLGAFVSPTGGTIDGAIHRNPVPFLGARGLGGVVWTQRTAAGALAVYLATMDRRGVWTNPSSIEDTFSPPGGDVRDASALLTAGNELFVVWTQAQPGHQAAYAAHRGASGVFDVPGSEPFLLSDPGVDALGPALGSGPDGGTVVVWSQQAGERWQVRARIRHAGDDRWSRPVTLSSPDADDAVSPDVAVGPDGRALVGWLEGPLGAARVQFASL